MILLVVFIFFVVYAQCQKLFLRESGGGKIYILSNPSEFHFLPSTCILTDIKRGSCKQIEYIFKDTGSLVLAGKISMRRDSIINSILSTKKKNFLSIHGNILYDYFCQSHLDTPFQANNIQQHTVTTFLDVRIKEDYPLRVYFTTRFGNTNYLKNVTNLNLQYSQQTFLNTIKEKIKSFAREPLDTSMLNQYTALLEEKVKSLNSIKNWMSDPSVLQRLVEERESEYVQRHRKKNLFAVQDTVSSKEIESDINAWLRQRLSKVKKIDSRKTESIEEIPLRQKFEEQKNRADSIQRQIVELRSKIQSKRDSINILKSKLASAINNLRNPNAIKSAIEQNNIPDSVLPKGYKTLLAIQKLNIGTAVVNYSELSAKDVTVSGLQVEYNPKFYYAIAAGVINYHFRNYLLPEAPGPKQYLGLMRFGKQSRDSSSLIFTYYYGRKMLYNYYTTDSLYRLTSPNPNFNLMGFTLEKRIRLNRYSFLTAEFAKSSLPYYHITTEGKQFSSVVAFSDHSNEAYSLKINSFIPFTQTSVEGYFKHYGANFQSFTLVSTSSAQNAFLISINQSFFRKHLKMNASIRKNDYINPFINQRYVSNTLFKSIQATLIMPRLPVVSIGFYPISQLMKLNNTTYSETLFYTLTANASYMYNTRHVAMNTTLGWMRFYNNPTDSGFAYFNTNNFFTNHSVFFPKATLRTSISYADNTKYNFISIGENLQWKVSKWFLVGGGIKYNKQDIMTTAQIGYDVNSTIKLGPLGSIQLRGEKSYIPGPRQQLVSNKIGRLTYYRSF